MAGQAAGAAAGSPGWEAVLLASGGRACSMMVVGTTHRADGAWAFDPWLDQWAAMRPGGPGAQHLRAAGLLFLAARRGGERKRRAHAQS